MRRISNLFALMAFAVLCPVSTQAQEEDFSQHFRVFTSEGQPASLDDILQAMSGVDAVLIGETHTDPVGHWVEAELFRLAVEAFQAGSEDGSLRPVALSMEMFERDVQYILDEYLQDLISETQFQASARAWEYYDEDYRSMVEVAKERGLPVIAANAPRRYVNRVSRMGRDAVSTLPRSATAFLPPLPYPQPTAAYRAEWDALMSNMSMEDQCPVPELKEVEEEEAPPHGMQMPPAEAPPHGEEPAMGGMPSHAMGAFMENGLQAQTLWDSSMGYAITTFLDTHPGGLVLHMVGGFHVENHTGTPEKVEFYRPGTRSLVVAMQLAEDIGSFDAEEHAGLGDFVILTDEAMDLYVPRNCDVEIGG
jgi:uncharacterized iron-regulated protein